MNGKTIATATEIISWDHEKSVISHSYNGTWGKGRGVWKPAGDTATLEWEIHGQFGTFEGKSKIKKAGDSWQWQIVEQTHDGELMPDMPVATFQRKTGELEKLAWLIGEWHADHKGSTVDLSFQWCDDLDRKFNQRHHTTGRRKERGCAGYDVLTKKRGRGTAGGRRRAGGKGRGMVELSV